MHCGLAYSLVHLLFSRLTASLSMQCILTLVCCSTNSTGSISFFTPLESPLGLLIDAEMTLDLTRYCDPVSANGWPTDWLVSSRGWIQRARLLYAAKTTLDNPAANIRAKAGISTSQGSVAKRLRCGEIFNENLIAHLLLTVSVKEFWTSVNILCSYSKNLVAYILAHLMYKRLKEECIKYAKIVSSM